MSEQIDWLKVVIDYGKRFPDVKLGDLFPLMYRGIKDFKISELYRECSVSETLRSQIDNENCIYHKESVFEYFTGRDDGWLRVPQHILLRLLTEGEEDLI